MKLYFNDTEIPVIWEDNQTVQELMEEAGKGDIVVQMSIVLIMDAYIWTNMRIQRVTR